LRSKNKIIQSTSSRSGKYLSEGLFPKKLQSFTPWMHTVFACHPRAKGNSNGGVCIAKQTIAITNKSSISK
jgi:hypothetical protein